MWQKILDILFPPRGRRKVARTVSVSNIPAHTRCTRTRSGVTVNTCTLYTNESVRALVHALKFDASPHAHTVCAQLLTDALTEHIAERVLFGEHIVITTIPASATRVHERGHDHLVPLAHAVCTVSNATYAPLLVRTRDTKRQMGLHATERLHNMHHAFACDSTYVRNQATMHVIVLDDVVTTGATLAEATRALHAAGIRTVSLWAIAHA